MLLTHALAPLVYACSHIGQQYLGISTPP
jgi:hypothetical protein